MTRIGIVGCGRILAAHLQGFRLLREAGVDDFRISALCARRESDAWMYVRRGEGPVQRPAVSRTPGDPLSVGDQYLSDFQDTAGVEVFTDYRRMIAEGPIDAVCDLTTHALHHQVAACAFEHRKDLLTQKPLAVSIAAAGRMCRDAEARDLVLGVFENARNKPATRQLRWLLETGDCGQLQMVLMGNAGTWWTPDRIVAETPWRHQLDQAGGITLDLGVHQAHVIRYLAGEIENVSGRTAVIEPVRSTRNAQGEIIRSVECDADDTFFASLETRSGVVGNLFASWSGRGAGTVLGAGAVYYATGGRVTGDELAMESPGQARQQLSLADWYAGRVDPQWHAQRFPLDLEDAFALNQLDWLQAIRQRREPETSGWEGFRDLAAAYAVLESNRAGRRVAVDEVAGGTLREYQRDIDRRFHLL